MKKVILCGYNLVGCEVLKILYENGTLGCTDVNACNFVAEATFSDNSCEYTSCTGCTNANACNYDSDALINEGMDILENCLRELV